MTEVRGETAPPTAPIPSRPVPELVHCGSSWRQLQIDASRLRGQFQIDRSRLAFAERNRHRPAPEPLERCRIAFRSRLEVVDDGDEITAGRHTLNHIAALLVRPGGKNSAAVRRPLLRVFREYHGHIRVRARASAVADGAGDACHLLRQTYVDRLAAQGVELHRRIDDVHAVYQDRLQEPAARRLTE